jgi:hypothetical protein
MLKAAGLAAVLFSLGAGAMALLSGWLGGASEAVALALVGAAMVGTSQALSVPGKVLSPSEG